MADETDETTTTPAPNDPQPTGWRAVAQAWAAGERAFWARVYRPPNPAPTPPTPPVSPPPDKR